MDVTPAVAEIRFVGGINDGHVHLQPYSRDFDRTVVMSRAGNRFLRHVYKLRSSVRNGDRQEMTFDFQEVA